MRGFLLIHGLENHRPKGHWMRFLAGSLREDGEYVAYPQLANPDFPVAEQWLEVLETEIQLMKEAGIDSVIVIAHSLGCVAWLKLIANGKLSIKFERVLLVAPADPKLLTAAPTFQDALDSDLIEIVKSRTDSIKVLASDNDHWLPNGVEETYGKPLRLLPIIWNDAGHISMNEGFGAWKGIVDWALDPTAELLTR
jgi:predicted alpha/beta hydrolase family esterase